MSYASQVAIVRRCLLLNDWEEVKDIASFTASFHALLSMDFILYDFLCSFHIMITCQPVLDEDNIYIVNSFLNRLGPSPVYMTGFRIGIEEGRALELC